MRGTSIPETLKYRDWTLTIAHHTRGGPSDAIAPTSFALGLGAKWSGRLQCVPSTIADGLKHRAWLHSLRGQSGSFYMRMRPMPKGPPYCTATTTGAAAGATTLALSSLSAAGAVSVGAFVTVVTATATQLIQIDSVTAGASPTITFRPALRSDAANGAAVVIGACTAEFRLAGATPRIPLRLDRADAFTIDFQEFR